MKGRQELTYEEIAALRAAQEAEFFETHGYEWPNCAVVECDYKASEGSNMCHNHTHGLPVPSIEEYFNGPSK